MAIRIDGKQCANELVEELAQQVADFKNEHQIVPGLAVVLVGDDPASAVYVRNKVKRAEQAGLNSIEHYLPSDVSQSDLEALIDTLNKDVNVHGILVQLPLPKHLSEGRVLKAISPLKDVDGFHPENVGKLVTGQPTLVPCTPLGCMIMLEQLIGDLSGKHAVIIGRSNIVGKPMAILLLQANCTVSVVHSKTQNIQAICSQADILVAAVGKPELVKKSWVKDDAVIIDVGINAVTLDGQRKLVGDVDYQDVIDTAYAITPVPGGVGPMTIACLMRNTLTAAKQQLAD